MKENTKKIVGTGVLTAIIVVLQFVASAIKFGPFSITLVLAPIVVGAALYGVLSGAWLGLTFGVTVLLSGDAAAFLTINPAGTVVTVLAKGMLAGLCAGAIYKLTVKLLDRPDKVAYYAKNNDGEVIYTIYKKNNVNKNLFATIVAGVVCPVVNTGIFLAGCYIFFQDWLTTVFGTTGFVTVVTGLVTVNFAVELGINLALATVIERIIRIGKKEVK